MSEWIKIGDEPLGMVQNKIWVTNGTDTALFKPDSTLAGVTQEIQLLIDAGSLTEEQATLLRPKDENFRPESVAELEFYRIATELDVSCAKTEAIDLFGRHGILSYDFKTNNSVIYCPVGQFYKKSKGFTHLSVNSRNEKIPVAGKLSFISLVTKAPHVLLQAIKMLYIDCLMCNTDRHGSNWELIMASDGYIIEIAPLFDHGLCMQFGLAGNDGYSEVTWDDDSIEENHFELFKKLVNHSSFYVKYLLNKTEHIKLNSFVADRFEIMKRIYKEIYDEKVISKL